MSMQPSTSAVIYQLHPDTANSMKGVREHLHKCCGSYLNHTVRVQTMDGHEFEGMIVALDGGHLYLNVASPAAEISPYEAKRAYYGYGYGYGYPRPRPPYYPYPYPSPYYNPGRVILPLVLYELLAISLL